MSFVVVPNASCRGFPNEQQKRSQTNPTNNSPPARDQVDAFYKAGLASPGAKDNGAPGVREMYHPNYYAAFLIDPVGNNIELVCHAPPS